MATHTKMKYYKNTYDVYKSKKSLHLKYQSLQTCTRAKCMDSEEMSFRPVCSEYQRHFFFLDDQVVAKISRIGGRRQLQHLETHTHTHTHTHTQIELKNVSNFH